MGARPSSECLVCYEPGAVPCCAFGGHLAHPACVNRWRIDRRRCPACLRRVTSDFELACSEEALVRLERHVLEQHRLVTAEYRAMLWRTEDIRREMVWMRLKCMYVGEFCCFAASASACAAVFSSSALHTVMWVVATVAFLVLA